MNDVDFVVASDLHFQENTPPCRLDCYLETLIKKMQWVVDFCHEKECPLLLCGDLFDHWKASPILLTIVTELFRHIDVYCISGQHDLPNHNPALFRKSALMTLHASEAITLIDAGLIEFNVGLGLKDSVIFEGKKTKYFITGAGWGASLLEKNIVMKHEDCIRVLLVHETLWTPKTKPDPMMEQGNASSFLKKHKQFDFIFSGDNHLCFAVEQKTGDRGLYNAGSVMRRTADMVNDTPSVFIMMSTGKVKKMVIPHDTEAVTREHIEQKDRRENNVNEFIESFCSSVKLLDFDFRSNIEKRMSAQKIDPTTRALTLACVDNDEELINNVINI